MNELQNILPVKKICKSCFPSRFCRPKDAMSNLEDLINITSVAGQSLDLNIFNQEYSAR